MGIKETGNDDVDQLRLAQDTHRLAGYITLHSEHTGMTWHQNLMWVSN